MFLLGSEAWTWLATVVTFIVAYALGALTRLPLPENKGIPSSSEESSRLSSSSDETDQLAVRTRKPGSKPSDDAEHVSPPTPSAHRVVSPLGRQVSAGSSEERDANQTNRTAEMIETAETVAVMAKADSAEATANSAAAEKEEGSPTAEKTSPSPPSPCSPRPSVRKVQQQAAREFAVVQFREELTRDCSVVVESEESFEEVKSTKMSKTSKAMVAKGSKATEKAHVSKPPNVAPMHKMRVTADGIPVVDVSDALPKETCVPASAPVTVLKRKVSPKLGSNSSSMRGMYTSGKYKSPSRTNSGSTTSPLSPRATNYVPATQNRAGLQEMSRVPNAGYQGEGRGKGGCGSATAQGQRYASVASGTAKAGVGNTRNIERAATGQPMASNSMHTTGSSIETEASSAAIWSSVSPVSSPAHRRSESERKLEDAWMMANMATANLGLGDSPDKDEKQAAWQTPWGTSSPATDLSNLLSQHSVSSDTSTNNMTTTNSIKSKVPTTDQEASNYGLDLYNSLSSLSWANSGSLSSFDSSLHRNPSTSERLDVFDTIKGIWGEAEEKRLNEMTH